MRIKASKLTVLGFVFAMIFSAVAGGVAVAATQVHMHNALNDLQSALAQLNVAVADKAGHREQAIKLVNSAIEQVNQGIAAAAQ